MNAPLLTVLMPVYNAEKYLQESIQSILRQSFHRFEFLIIDDASTDSSVAMIESFTDSRIRLVKNETNRGISETLNLGIELATTELIARMDADDISYPERLEKQYAFFRNHPACSMLSTRARVVSANKVPVRTDKFSGAYYYYNLIFICWVYHPTVMYKRSAVLAAGKYTERFSEDFELWWRLSRTNRIDHLDEVLLDYRLSETSLSNVSHKAEYEDAQRRQVLRNVQYYTGRNFHLTIPEIECLRHNFAPLVDLRNLAAIRTCLKKIDQINVSILQKDNINCNKSDILEAAHYKKEFILDGLLNDLSLTRKIILLLSIGRLKQVLRIVCMHFLTRDQKKPAAHLGSGVLD